MTILQQQGINSATKAVRGHLLKEYAQVGQYYNHRNCNYCRHLSYLQLCAKDKQIMDDYVRGNKNIECNRC